MKRIPSIHINELDLATVLHVVHPERNMVWHDKILSYEDFAKAILKEARSLSIPSRSIRVSNDKLDKKVEKLKLAGRSDTAVFAQMLLHIRRKLKHRGLRIIKPGEPEWFNIKETCMLATDFSNEFGLKVKDGYKVYLEIGLPMMKNFSIHKFKTMHSSICNKYEALQEIERDKTPAKTEEAHDTYMGFISERVGYSQSYKDNPEKYQCFIKVKQEALHYGVTIKQYISSQFSAFEYKSSVPDPMQLTGSKAIERLQRFCYEKNIKMGNKLVKVSFDKIKQLRKNGK